MGTQERDGDEWKSNKNGLRPKQNRFMLYLQVALATQSENLDLQQSRRGGWRGLSGERGNGGSQSGDPGGTGGSQAS